MAGRGLTSTWILSAGAQQYPQGLSPTSQGFLSVLPECPDCPYAKSLPLQTLNVDVRSASYIHHHRAVCS